MNTSQQIKATLIVTALAASTSVALGDGPPRGIDTALVWSSRDGHLYLSHELAPDSANETTATQLDKPTVSESIGLLSENVLACEPR